LGVLLQTRVGVQEDDALGLQVLTDLVVDHLGLVLRGDTGDQPLLLRLRDAQLVVGVLDVLGQLVPAGGLLLGGPDEVLDRVEVDAGQVRAPVGQRLALEQLEALQPLFEHPLGLVLLRRDVAHDVLVEASPCAGTRHVTVSPAVLVLAQRRDGLFLGQGLRGGGALLCSGSHAGFPSSRGPALFTGTCVVHAASPRAMVASRCTCVPSNSANAAVSASHSCGNSAATWATGQWCWHSCSPAPTCSVEAA